MTNQRMTDIEAVNIAARLRPIIAAHLNKGVSASRLYKILARALGDDLLSVAAFADRTDDRIDAVIRVAAKHMARAKHQEERDRYQEWCELGKENSYG